MMNSSSLSRSAACFGLGACIVLANALLMLASDGYRAIAPFTALFAFACMVGGGVFLWRLNLALVRAAAVCAAAARGDLEARILGIPEAGTLGVIQHGINAQLDITDAFVREAGGSMRQVSEGRYFRKVLLRGLPGAFQAAARTINAATDSMEQKARAFAEFADRNVKAVIDNVSAAASEMHADAEALSRIATDASQRATAAAAATEQASCNVQAVAAAAEELASSAAEISRQVVHASRIAGRAVEQSVQTDATISGLAQAVHKVSAVVQLIQAIAGRTNLLALNATIEAARAGEAGRGFAVVAGEVKSLAGQTARATEDIAAQITAIHTATGAAISAVKGIGGTIGEIDGISTAIAAAVEQQGAAAQEIARNIQQAAMGAGEAAGNIAGMSGAAGETGEAAVRLLDSAGHVSREAGRLRVDAGEFLRRARAA